MKIDITARHFSLSDHLRILVNEKVDKIEKFNNGILNCSVVLTKDSSEENVEIVAHAKGQEFIARDNSGVFEKSLAIAVEKISIQIKKHHDKVIGR